MEQNKELTFVPAVIEFDDFEEHKARALSVAEYIDSIELTGSNVKEVKGTLADARKLVNALEDRRKEIKNEVLAPYKVFEAQVKEITGIIDQADSRLRTQIRELEEREREEKEAVISELWEKRMEMYNFGKYVPDAFSMWLEPRHLNKSTSMKSVEAEMVSFMEDTEKDVAAILAMPDAEDVMLEYAGTLNIADALEAVRAQREYREKAFQEDAPTAEERATFVITGKVNITLTEKLLQENGIEYRRI